MSASLSYNAQYGRLYGETFYPGAAAPVLGIASLSGADGAGLTAKSTPSLGDVKIVRGPGVGGSGTVSGTATLAFANAPTQNLFATLSVEGGVTISGQQTTLVSIAFATSVDPGNEFKVHYELAGLY